MLVVAIIGVMAGVLLPRLSFYFEPPAAVLQRAIEEAQDIALSGSPVRFYIKDADINGRGIIETEALLKREVPADSISAFLGTSINKPEVLEWTQIDMKNIPVNEGWRFAPQVIYFFIDGSCTPARISWAAHGISDKDADEYILTVTGYCAMIEK